MATLQAGARQVLPASNADHEWSGGDILAGISGTRLSADDFTAALRQSGDIDAALHVVAVDVVPGSELQWPQSHSAKLRLSLGAANGVADKPPAAEIMLYLKKIIAQGLPPKPLHGLRRDLASNRNEARFYQEFAPVLSKRGLPLLRTVHIQEHWAALDDGAIGSRAGDIVDASEEEKALRGCGLLMVLESAEGYSQTSPLSYTQAQHSLRLLAKMHAVAWEDKELLSQVGKRLHSVGGYWTLDKRGEGEMQQMRDNWQQYVANFQHAAPELFERQEIIDLAERIERVSVATAKHLAPAPDAEFATLIHGDYKAMNIFLQSKEVDFSESSAQTCKRRRLLANGALAVPIDFQWSGVGFGMSDVAMHLSHSVAVEALQGDDGRDAGERQLVEFYRSALLDEIGGVASASYTSEVAWHHYCLAVVDYARMLLGCFFKSASPESFQARAEKQNVGLAYRNVEASLLFVERADSCLRAVEHRSPE